MQNVRPRLPTRHRKVFARKWRPKSSIQLRQLDGGPATRSQIEVVRVQHAFGALFSVRSMSTVDRRLQKKHPRINELTLRTGLTLSLCRRSRQPTAVAWLHDDNSDRSREKFRRKFTEAEFRLGELA